MSFPLAARHCEAHRVEMCVGMGCGNLISKIEHIIIYISRLPRRANAQINAPLLAMTLREFLKP
jgi:hypothetical protein